MQTSDAHSEYLIDDILLLSLWAQTQERSSEHVVGDRIKATKLAFLLAYPLYQKKIKAINLKFFRYKRGPYATGLNTVWNELQSQAFLEEEEVFTVTEKGMRLAQHFLAEVLSLPENREIEEQFQQVLDEYAMLSTPEIMSRVYGMLCVPTEGMSQPQTIREMPYFVDLTQPVDEAEAVASLQIPVGWQATLDLAFDPEALDNLRQGIEDTYNGKMINSEDMWASV